LQDVGSFHGVKGNRRGGADHGGGCWRLVFFWRVSGGL
jgi:hypothetical protein